MSKDIVVNAPRLAVPGTGNKTSL